MVRTTKAHTLAELLVALAILSLLLLLLLSMLNHTTRAWRGSARQIDAATEARAALDCIRRDLANIRTGAHFPLYLNSSIADMDRNGVFAPLECGDRIFFFSVVPRTAQNTAANRSSLCSIGYYLSPSSAAAANIYDLHRYFYSSDETWAWGPTTNGCSSGGLRAFLLNPAASLYHQADGKCDEVLARNVLGFSIQPGRSDFSRPTLWPPDEKPAFFDVQIRVCSSDAARHPSTIIEARFRGYCYSLCLKPD